MKTYILTGLLTLAAAAAVVPETAAAYPLTANLKASEGCMIGNACHPLNVDVPAYVWLVGGNQTQAADADNRGQKEIKDASLGLQTKTTAIA